MQSAADQYSICAMSLTSYLQVNIIAQLRQLNAGVIDTSLVRILSNQSRIYFLTLDIRFRYKKNHS